jgi:hypothetical protein
MVELKSFLVFCCFDFAVGVAHGTMHIFCLIKFFNQPSSCCLNEVKEYGVPLVVCYIPHIMQFMLTVLKVTCKTYLTSFTRDYSEWNFMIQTDRVDQS